MATVITKSGDSIVTTVDGEVTNVQSIRREDNVISVVPSSDFGEVFNIVREISTGNIIVYYDSSFVTIEPTNLTGAEIVALLEALGAGNRLSHSKLDDVGASDHHTKYTDAAAVTAAKTVKLDDFTAPDDNTDLDFSTSKHGLVPKGTNIGDFLKDDGTWSTVTAGTSAEQALAFALMT
ncbi:hypothetical protein LCGC14_2936550 [marine sediment metagenome]|uniref:Uncharacterized protein n=1 Tax=marine sediment metagenome TaxID=412755 RepID=A0A0F8XJ73_9ZZZZ